MGPFRLLDVGAGEHSCTKTKEILPACEYYGLDINRDYANSPADFGQMAGFFEMDLTRLAFDPIGNGFFDAILMSHVIEHLRNGDAVIRGLIPKLKPGGVLYVEFPGPRSTKLPHMRGTLNFCDDPTHVRVYSAREIADVASDAGCRIERLGRRPRNWVRIALMPLAIPQRRRQRGYVKASDVWDLFAPFEYVLARRAGP